MAYSPQENTSIDPLSFTNLADWSTSYNDHSHAVGGVDPTLHAHFQPQHLSYPYRDSDSQPQAEYPQESQHPSSPYPSYNRIFAGRPLDQYTPQMSSFDTPTASLQHPTSLLAYSPTPFDNPIPDSFPMNPAHHGPDRGPSNIAAQAFPQHQMSGNHPDAVPTNPVPLHSHQHPTLAPGLHKILQYLICHPSSRQPISWVPDCPVSLQNRFQPPGLLWAFAFRCRFKGCGYTASRDTSSYERYFRSVWDHLLNDHAEAMPIGEKLAACGWEGCKSRGLNFKYTRDKMRHIVTHLPYYTLCTQCGSISARRDSRGAKSPCASGNCSPAGDYAERIHLAGQVASQSDADFTIASYFDIVSQE